MTSEKQISTNRRNAGLSTGPRSEAGRARSSRNALKHGLTAENVVLFDEDPAAFDELRHRLYERYQLSDPVADHLVERVAANMWRLRRVPEFYAAIFEDCYLSVKANRAGSGSYQLTWTAEKREFEKRRDDSRPMLGHVFSKIERSLSSLLRIETAIANSIYRDIRELERIKEKHDQQSTEVIEAEELPVCAPPRRRARPREMK